VEIRPARKSDADEVARVHVHSWQAAYRGLLPDSYLDALLPQDRSSHYRFEEPDPDVPLTLVAVEGSTITGFATIGRCADDPDQTGELYGLYVDPPFWGTGTGRSLIASARDRLRDRGFGRAVLWVLVGNERAERFYRRDGWSNDDVRRHDEMWGIGIEELRYSRGLT
jgi:GNAT superfamily N-acetyltransferase